MDELDFLKPERFEAWLRSRAPKTVLGYTNTAELSPFKLYLDHQGTTRGWLTLSGSFESPRYGHIDLHKRILAFCLYFIRIENFRPIITSEALAVWEDLAND